MIRFPHGGADDYCCVGKARIAAYLIERFPDIISTPELMRIAGDNVDLMGSPLDRKKPGSGKRNE